jgi:hypothetical protein
MVLLLLWMALGHRRNEELFGLLAPLLVAAPLAVQLPPAPSTEPPPTPRGRIGAPAGLVRSAAVAAILIDFFATAAVLDRTGLTSPGRVAPAAALAAPGSMAGCSIPNFVDGRADLFGDAFLERYVAAADAVGDALPRLLGAYSVDWTLLEPASPAVAVLDPRPGWRRVYADR